MKKTRTIAVSIILYFGVVSLLAGCSRYEHKKEEKKIKRERSETDKAGSDLNTGVLVTDTLDWDAVKDYTLFRDSSLRRINLCRKNLTAFKKSKMNKHGKIPVIYRNRISKMEEKSHELEHRIQDYVIKDRSSWEDFCKLVNFDLMQLENSVNKLSRKTTARLLAKNSPPAIIREFQFSP